MFNRILVAILAFTATATLIVAQDIRRGKVKSVDAEKGIVVVTADGKDIELNVSDRTRVFGAEDKKGADRLKVFKAGDAVMFAIRSQDGKDVLIGLKAGGDGAGRPPAKLVKVDTSSFKPLTTLGKEKYKGHEGGLYPDGKNERPEAHEAAGLAIAKDVQPLGPDGKPAADGKIVLLSVGMSNATQCFSAFVRLANPDAEKNPAVVLADGAQGGMTAVRIKNPDDNASGTQYWTTVDNRLKQLGVTREQVQVAWMKQADAGPSSGFPKYAETLRDEEREIVLAMKKRFPNLKLFYLSSRTYGGYATTGLNPEPYAFESGLAVKWLIEEQLKGDAALNFDPKKGDVKAPWLAWGPYIWANGKAKNPDGLFYEESDFGNDGTHPSASGQRKVAEQLLKFFKTDSTTKGWFVKAK